MPGSDPSESIVESLDTFSLRKEAKRVELIFHLRIPVSKVRTLFKGIAR
jgi:hypothetical protein